MALLAFRRSGTSQPAVVYKTKQTKPTKQLNCNISHISVLKILKTNMFSGDPGVLMPMTSLDLLASTAVGQWMYISKSQQDSDFMSV